MQRKYILRILTRLLAGIVFMSGTYFLMWTSDRRVTTVSLREASNEERALKSTQVDMAGDNTISSKVSDSGHRPKPPEQLSPRKTSKQLYEADNPGEHIQKPGGVCTFEYRQQRLEEMCRKSPPPPKNTKLSDKLMRSKREKKRKDGLSVTVVLFDHRRKVLGCTICKVASTSWIRYMVINSLNKSADVTESVSFKRFQLQQYGMTNQASIPVSDLSDPKYKDWKTYLIVRHPLQRVVSAYYQVTKKLKRFKFTFLEYMEGLANGELVDADEHWARYSSWCHACEVKYDYILKMETMAEDLPAFNRGVGIDENATLPGINTNQVLDRELKRRNEKAADEYIHKYEKHLVTFQREHPDIFQKVLDLYQHDMDSYGYSWDTKNNSTCGYGGSEDVCC